MGNLFASKVNQHLFTGVLGMAVIALGSYAYITLKQSSELNYNTINIIGKGEMVATPDLATFSFSVKAEGVDTTEAQSKSATALNAVMDYLKEQGVEDKDVKTEGYNVSPKYSYETKPCAVGMYCPPSDPVQVGVEANQTVTVKVRKLDTAGAILAGVGQKGATDISGLMMSLENPDSLKEQARNKAIADARSQAEVLAAQLGVHLGDITGYYEDEGGMPTYDMMAGAPMSAKAEAAPVAPTIAAGEQKVQSTVTVTYKIK